MATGTTYAKKTLNPGAIPEAIARFIREAKLLSKKLDHKNVVRVVDASVDAPPYFFIMPLYRTSLDNEIGPISRQADRIPLIYRAILDGVDHAHSRGIVHR